MRKKDGATLPPGITQRDELRKCAKNEGRLELMGGVEPPAQNTYYFLRKEEVVYAIYIESLSS